MDCRGVDVCLPVSPRYYRGGSVAAAGEVCSGRNGRRTDSAQRHFMLPMRRLAGNCSGGALVCRFCRDIIMAEVSRRAVLSAMQF
jgi:hypothetical protein